MNPGHYTLKAYLTENNLNQILIPEIQRDYVWKKKNVMNLLSSIAENAGLNNQSQRVPTNIGFIYAYSDEQMQGHYILIDGQQRITTVFYCCFVLRLRKRKKH